MLTFNKKLKTIGAGLMLSATSLAFAGSECGNSQEGPGPAVMASAIKSANATIEQLNKSSDNVVLLARMGQDLSKYNLTYSHLAYAVKKDDGQWAVVHKLNTCGTAKAGIFEESLERFYLDDLFSFQAGLWRLSPDIQAKLKPVLLGKDSLKLHEPHYNMVAYPFSTKFQNSNGWVLEVLANAINPAIQTRTDALTWLGQQGYAPSVLNINAATRLGARATKSNISFDDHPSRERWAGRIQVATVDSVVKFVGQLPHVCKTAGCPEETLPNR